MKIGIDLDGVIFDSEQDFRVYQELYDMLELKQNSKIDDREARFEKRYNWTEDTKKNFLDKYHAQVVTETNYMPGAQMILKMLKDEGHELIVITARGGINPSIIPVSEQRFQKDNMLDLFDKCYYAIKDKAEVCKKENIDIMIDDSYENCKNTSENKIKTIYFKDAPSYDLEENEYLKVLYNWGEVYRYLKDNKE